jgi:hypothetical protein
MNEQHTFVDIGDTLAGVILGCRFPQTLGVFALCNSLGVDPWQMSWEMSRPSPHRMGQD